MLEACNRESQLVNHRILALRAELEIFEPEGVKSQCNKSPRGSGKGQKRKSEFNMKEITIPINGIYTKGESPLKRLLDAESRAWLYKGHYFKGNEKYYNMYR